MQIYRPDKGHISVREAVDLLRGALPVEPAGDVYARVSDTGEIDWSSVEVKVNERSAIRSAWLEQDFVSVCRKLGIKPRNKYRPGFEDFSWSSKTEEYYVISHDEFVRYVAEYGVSVRDEPLPEKTTLKRAALVQEVVEDWPSVEADLRDGSRNGLKEAAHDGSGWVLEDAMKWAESRGKLRKRGPKRGPASPFDGL